VLFHARNASDTYRTLLHHILHHVSRRKYKAPEPFWHTAKRKFQEDPAVPIFTAGAVVALLAGMGNSFIKKDPVKANKYMFLRVVSQGLAAAGLVWSIVKAGTGKDL